MLWQSSLLHSQNASLFQLIHVSTAQDIVKNFNFLNFPPKFYVIFASLGWGGGGGGGTPGPAPPPVVAPVTAPPPVVRPTIITVCQNKILSYLFKLLQTKLSTNHFHYLNTYAYFYTLNTLSFYTTHTFYLFWPSYWHLRGPAREPISYIVRILRQT